MSWGHSAANLSGHLSMKDLHRGYVYQKVLSRHLVLEHKQDRVCTECSVCAFVVRISSPSAVSEMFHLALWTHTCTHAHHKHTLNWTGEWRDCTTVLVSSVQIIRDSEIHTAQCPETIPYPLTQATQRTWLYVSTASFCFLTLTGAILDSCQVFLPCRECLLAMGLNQTTANIFFFLKEQKRWKNV